jgi:hypothetical protein
LKTLIAPRELPTPPGVRSLPQCDASLRSFAALSSFLWMTQQQCSARMCPSIPRGHFAMCPQRPSSSPSPILSKRF